MNSPSSKGDTEKPGLLDRGLQLFGDVRTGEGVSVLLLLTNLLLILLAYNIIKVVREPLILSMSGGAKLKSYSAASQAVVLMAFIPFYSWFSSRVRRMNLIVGITLFFVLNIEMFSLAVKLDVLYVGFAFFIWVGIFSLSVIAQFWSLANDLYSRTAGERLFPIIGIGSALGSPIGSKIAQVLFDSGTRIHNIMHISSVILLFQIFLTYLAHRREAGRSESSVQPEARLAGRGGFSLVFASRYLLLISLLLLLLNIVNTNGGYILDSRVVEAAGKAVAANPALSEKVFIGSFYARFYFWVNIAGFVLQSLVASRIVKYTGINGVVLLLPLVALGTYFTALAGAGMVLFRWVKTAENATDYSVMNTARAMLWLPTTREEKYKAKQTVDTFVVRSGDVLSAGCVFAGTTWLQMRTSGFAALNIVLTLVWIVIAWRLLRKYKQLTE